MGNAHSINQSFKNQCCICYKKLGTRGKTVTKCNHVFCFDCMIKCLEYKNTCPYCRTELVSSTKEPEVENSPEDAYLFNEWYNTSSDENGLCDLNKLESIVEEENMSVRDILALWTCRYDNEIEYVEMKEKANYLIKKIIDADKDKKNETTERSEMSKWDNLIEK